MNRRILTLAALLSVAAHAESSTINLHLEPGVAVVVGGPQQTWFNTGFGGALKADFAVYRFLALQLTGQAMQFASGRFGEPGRAFSFGGGVRLRLLDDDSGYALHIGKSSGHKGGLFGNLWIDLGADVVGTGGLVRPGLNAGIGVELSVVDDLNLGPYVKYVHIFQPSDPNALPDHGYILMAGLSVSTSFPSSSVHVSDPDRDHDGTVDLADACPDVSGLAANSGCPDTDRDRDAVVDRLDRCPDEAGSAANGGCPSLDGDRDGLADNVDRCPTEPGPTFNAGCPVHDGDRDGLADNVDRCPKQAGPATNQGCPELDGDGDLIVDRVDRCPTEPETFNNFQDDDGCPDKGDALLVVTRDEIKIRRQVSFDKVAFGTAVWKVSKDSYKVLAAVAKVLFLDPNRRIRIEGHTDDRGGRTFNEQLSRKRAEAVRTHLIEVNGIEPERLDAVGFAFDRPLEPNTHDEARARNRRVEFHFVNPVPAAPVSAGEVAADERQPEARR